MKIAIVSKLWEEVSPFSRGGTGASIGALVDALVERGHKVTLFATGNSKTKAQRLVSQRRKPFADDYSEIQEYANIAAAFRRHKEFDIIHCAVEHKSVLFGALVDTPSLHSIRYGEFFAHELRLLKDYRKLDFMANSQAVKKAWPFLNWQGVVYNGVDLGKFRFNAKAEDYLLFFGRLSPQKGVDLAIQAALKAKKKLLLYGRYSAVDAEFLAQRVWPFVDGGRIVYGGEISGQKKIKLIGRAQALLQPARIFEACSNTIIEAMACGTPIIAFDQGSNRELVKSGQTGFIVKNLRQMEAAIKNLGKIKRLDCRRRAETHFSAEKMTNQYLSLYNKIINKHKV